jgi:hypothetical protein
LLHIYSTDTLHVNTLNLLANVCSQVALSCGEALRDRDFGLMDTGLLRTPVLRFSLEKPIVDMVASTCVQNWLAECGHNEQSLASDLSGLTSAMPIVGTKGSKTRIHCEEGNGGTLNLLLWGFKIFFTGHGLLRWARHKFKGAEEGTCALLFWLIL